MLDQSITTEFVNENKEVDSTVICDYDDFFTVKGELTKERTVNDIMNCKKAKLVRFEDDEEIVDHITLLEYLNEWRDFPRDSSADIIRVLLNSNAIIKRVHPQKSIFQKDRFQVINFVDAINTVITHARI